MLIIRIFILSFITFYDDYTTTKQKYREKKILVVKGNTTLKQATKGKRHFSIVEYSTCNKKHFSNYSSYTVKKELLNNRELNSWKGNSQLQQKLVHNTVCPSESISLSAFSTAIYTLVWSWLCWQNSWILPIHSFTSANPITKKIGSNNRTGEMRQCETTDFFGTIFIDSMPPTYMTAASQPENSYQEDKTWGTKCKHFITHWNSFISTLTKNGRGKK